MNNPRVASQRPVPPEGRFHAELFVSRPREEARSAPLADIVTVTSGRNCPVGARYVRVGEGADARITLEP